MDFSASLTFIFVYNNKILMKFHGWFLAGSIPAFLFSSSQLGDEFYRKEELKVSNIGGFMSSR